MIFKSVCVCLRVHMCVHAGTHMEVKEPCVLTLTLLLEIGSLVHCCPCQAGPRFSRAHLFPPPMSRQQDGDCRCVLCACLYLDSENANSGPHNLGSDLPLCHLSPLRKGTRWGPCAWRYPKLEDFVLTVLNDSLPNPSRPNQVSFLPRQLLPVSPRNKNYCLISKQNK